MLQNLYQLPVTSLGLATFVLLLAAAFTGHRVGLRTPEGDGKELNRNAVAGIVGVVALLLAFTLGFSLTRFQDRRVAVVNEANTIMTAFLRADLLPDPERTELRETIRAYAATRQFAGTADIAAALSRSLAAQEELWPQAVALTEGRLAGAERALVLSAINDVLDDHLRRAAAASERLPLPVLGLAVALACAAVFLSAFNEHTRRFPVPTFVLQSFGIAALVMLILDFDNTTQGLVTIDPWIMSSTVEEMDRILSGG